MTVKPLAFLVGVLVSVPVGAQVVKCVDAAGKTHYIEQSAAGQMKCQPVKDAANVVPPQAGARPSSPPPAPPKAQPGAAQLAQAEKELDEARRKLSEQESIRTGNERNYARVEERLAPYRKAVADAEKKLQDLRNQR
jgi:hypothetical protein